MGCSGNCCTAIDGLRRGPLWGHVQRWLGPDQARFLVSCSLNMRHHFCARCANRLSPPRKTIFPVSGVKNCRLATLRLTPSEHSWKSSSPVTARPPSGCSMLRQTLQRNALPVAQFGKLRRKIFSIGMGAAARDTGASCRLGLHRGVHAGCGRPA